MLEIRSVLGSEVFSEFEGLISSRFGKPLEAMLEGICPPESIIRDVVSIRSALATRFSRGEVALFEGTFGILEELTSRGWTLAIATNKPQALLNTVIENFELGSYLRAWFGLGELGLNPKPSPDLIFRCLSEMEEGMTLYVGDSEEDCLAAAAAGVTMVHVRRGIGLISCNGCNSKVIYSIGHLSELVSVAESTHPTHASKF